jgi:AhpD family alkylhydroperoxidase
VKRKAGKPQRNFEELSRPPERVSDSTANNSRLLLKVTKPIQPMKLDTKTKRLIAVAVATYTTSEYCIVSPVYKCPPSRCNSEEIIEASLLSVNFGGGPAYAQQLHSFKDAVKRVSPQKIKNKTIGLDLSSPIANDPILLQNHNF